MPVMNLEERRCRQRNQKRTKRHGHWRHVIDHWHGLCAICGEKMMDELHEPFGEDHHNDGRLQARIPVCRDCHNRERNGWDGDMGNRARITSTYIEDIEEEIDKCGGHAEWCRKYKIPYGAPVFQGRMI